MNELTKKERGIYEDPKGIDPLLWEELNKLDRNEVASRASVQYNTNNTCFLIPFLDRIYGCNPTQQFIRDTSETAEELSFQLYLVLLNYLIRVKPLGISGRMVTGQELKGGDFFFKGPHVLFTRPLEKRFDRDPDAFTEAGLKSKDSMGSPCDLPQSVPQVPKPGECGTIQPVRMIWSND